MPEQKNITAIILAGGKSSRMGFDKGLVHFNGKMLVSHVIEAVKPFASQVIIVTSNPEYKQLGYPCMEDEAKEKGPLMGIVTGLAHSSTQKNLVVGCDMPFLTKNVLSSLIENSGDEDVLLTVHKGWAEPLCSIYDRNCITHIRSKIEQNQLKITDALMGLKTRLISFDDEDWFHGNEFANINSIEELKKYNL
jgi:molybdopterin-guanine dinucleotide biosynthesis protein A